MRVPQDYGSNGIEYDSIGFGSLPFYGPFAVTTTTDISGNIGYFLERCGTHLHDRLDVFGLNPVGNRREIVWLLAPSHLSGVFLPSRRRFTIKLPDPLRDPADVELGARSLCVIRHRSRLWVAPAPRLARG